MLDRKKLLIAAIIAAIGFIFFIFVVISAFTSKNLPSDQTTASPTPEQLIIPTSSSTSLEKETSLGQQSADNVQLLSINPQDGSIDQSPVLQISLTFSEPMKERSFYYKVNPQVPTYISTDGNNIVITPKHVWTMGQNTITVFAESETVTGKHLSTPFTYQFTVKDLPFPDDEVKE